MKITTSIATAGSLLFISFVTLCPPATAASSTSLQPLKLQPIASGFSNITDIQFLPNSSKQAIVLEKTGSAFLLDMIQAQKRSKILQLKVASSSELGLLGFAFHPRFSETKKVFVHYNPSSDISRISEWSWRDPLKSSDPVTLGDERIILEVGQPYKNHNGGSLVFGPDGFLYIGLGDGGSRGDPENRSQNLETLLGKMLRINIDNRDKTLNYAIPSDNPFAGSKVSPKGARPEIFAWGLRNPWKYSFDGRGRLIAGDVGQDTWEEITFVPKGANLGWRFFEGSHCYVPPQNCQTLAQDAVAPIAEYGREFGASITGGFQYGGSLIPSLKGRYVFGDFVSGRVWSITLPDKESTPTTPSKDFYQHGKYNIAISTFAKDSRGEIYVADFEGGRIFQLTQ